jgi:hypothetical protein
MMTMGIPTETASTMHPSSLWQVIGHWDSAHPRQANRGHAHINVTRTPVRILLHASTRCALIRCFAARPDPGRADPRDPTDPRLANQQSTSARVAWRAPPNRACRSLEVR